MLSQTTEYALRAMVWLAYTENELVPTSTLAERTLVPFNYLAKVLHSLAQANLIEGRRGVGGGYKLSRSADQISILDIVNAISPVHRIDSCPLGIAAHGTRLCPLHRKLDGAIASLIETFKDVSLLELLDEKEVSRPLCDPGMLEQFGLTISGRKIIPRN
ncbi:MAG: Rrf2 family transcriptional regulator [Phycisphaeraceae bacterium]|nr:Rrf2 family transcriptional regulator [Phycisphaeraceae bacterium]MCW5761755.1 Rrf2 family transcriptional regulator [Phycisphaeraceae bacterium]